MSADILNLCTQPPTVPSCPAKAVGLLGSFGLDASLPRVLDRIEHKQDGEHFGEEPQLYFLSSTPPFPFPGVSLHGSFSNF